MIDAIDHIVLICPDIEAGAAVYEGLLGRPADWRSGADGAVTALFQVQNTALELMAPNGETGAAPRLRELLDERGPGLISLAFRTSDIENAHHTLTRRGLAPDDVSDGMSRDERSGETRTWKRFRCSDASTASIKTFILQPEATLPFDLKGAGAVNTLDHIVIATPNPDRALAIYGAKLGLDLRLDRTADQWKTRFLFFRLGGLTLEITHRLGETHDPDAPDRIWGLTWAVEDLEAAHTRLAEAGLDVSGIRTGRKPGSRVFTLRSGTLGVPTLFISHTPR